MVQGGAPVRTVRCTMVHRRRRCRKVAVKVCGEVACTPTCVQRKMVKMVSRKVNEKLARFCQIDLKQGEGAVVVQVEGEECRYMPHRVCQPTRGRGCRCQAAHL